MTKLAAMPATERVTILLADEDSLRRDGLSAVLAGTDQLSVVGGVPDGELALAEIRQNRPDIAVVDLNLPKIHGIELIRRVRAEGLRTRIVILAGTTDDEIVREVVRAGGDGYLLKNGPARHLLDAISYVQDGGQYFSPQLGRDGRDRHLLEEPPRFRESGGGASDEDFSAPENGFTERRSPRNRSVRVRKERRVSDSRPLRERIRENASGSELSDRDYEIMSMMADGIRPILDRLDEIDNRVSQMEDGESPLPASPRGWLNHEIAETLGESGAPTRNASLAELERSLPLMIEDAVTKRFNQMAGQLQQNIEETHVRTLETFVKNIQVKLVQRVSALEQDMSQQAEAMLQLREYSQRTEDNLSRLISGVDRLAQDLPRRIATPGMELATIPSAYAGGEERQAADPQPQPPLRPRRQRAQSRRPQTVLAVLGAIAVLALLVWGVARLASRPAGPAPQAASVVTAGGKKVALPANADIRTKLQAAQQYTDSKDYASAEDIYKQIVADDPNNAEAWKGLASVLYREDKVDESAAAIEHIPKN